MQKRMKLGLSIIILISFIALLSLAIAETSATKEYSAKDKSISIKDKGNVVAQYNLTYNTDFCGYECSAQGTAYFKDDSQVFDSFIFKDKSGKNKSLEYKIIISNSTETSDYDKKPKKGMYKWRIIVWKQPYETVDWIANSLGLDLTEWAWFTAVPFVYDEIDNSAVDSAKWYNSTTTPGSDSQGITLSETADYMELLATTGTSASSLTLSGWVASNNMPDITILDNITMQVYLESTSSDAGGSQSAPSCLFIFGNSILCIDRGTGSGTLADSSIWTVKKNSSLGVNKFTVYNDGAFSSNITAVNNSIKLTTSVTKSAGSIRMDSKARFYYVYYAKIGSVTLNSPANSSSLTSRNVTLNCSANVFDGSNITNISLWGNFTGDFKINQTLSISYLNKSSYNASFNLLLADVKSYSWNCQAYDNSTDFIFSEANYSFSIPDVTIPAVTINKPNSTEYNRTVFINITLSDNVNISYAYYNITRGASIEVSNTAINLTNSTSYAVTSGDADYIINVWANDTSNNANYTTRSFTVTSSGTVAPPIIINTGSGGGGGTTIITQILGVKNATAPGQICIAFKPALDKAWTDARKDGFSSTAISTLFSSLWDYVICKSTASIVPI
jgi:hypothetical protein